MSDYAPPAGPPPPKLPAGWTAQYNQQYQEWFYVNIYTKKSQWDKPTEPVYGPPDSTAPDGPPPGYRGSGQSMAPHEKGAYGSNNPYGSASSLTDDEKLARQLQAEEDAKAQGRPTSRGAADQYYGAGTTQAYHGQSATPYGQSASPYGQSASPYGQSASTAAQQELPPRDGKSRGFFSKLMGNKQNQPQAGYGGGYGGQPAYAQQGGYGGQQGYYQQGYPQQAYQQPQRQHHGLGTAGGAALGLGGGLLGGMLLGDAIGDMGDSGDGGGGDYGGDDGGGGGDDGGGGDF